MRSMVEGARAHERMGPPPHPVIPAKRGSSSRWRCRMRHGDDMEPVEPPASDAPRHRLLDPRFAGMTDSSLPHDAPLAHSRFPLAVRSCRRARLPTLSSPQSGDPVTDGGPG